MYKNKNIGVVIPAYNEERLIGRVIETMPDFVDRIIIVDDNSKDNTAQVIESYFQSIGNRLVLLRNEKNEGCGGALSKGYEWILKSDIDIAVRMDGDGQMNPDDLALLIDPVAEGKAEYSKGNRLFTGEAYHKIPKLRYFGNAILSLLTKIASGYWHVADFQSGYTAIDKKALRRIDLKRMYKRYGQPNDILIRLNVNNCRVADVPVTPVYNIGEKSGMKIKVVIFTISWLLLKLFFWRLKEKYIIRDFHPLVFFYAMGVSLLLASFVLLVRLIYMWSIAGHIPPINALSWMFSVSIGFQSLFFAMWFDMECNKEMRQ